MIHPGTELRRVSSDIGFGVFATEKVPRGTITWVRDDLDLVITPADLAAMPEAYRPLVERYGYLDPAGYYVVCWDFGRYMNHSCEASTTCLGTLCDIAARDIQPGEQLTCEYALSNLQTEFVCRCGAPACRGVIRAADLPAVAKAIDARVALIVPEIANRLQPLRPFFRAADERRLARILAGTEPIPSALENLPRRSY